MSRKLRSCCGMRHHHARHDPYADYNTGSRSNKNLRWCDCGCSICEPNGPNTHQFRRYIEMSEDSSSVFKFPAQNLHDFNQTISWKDHWKFGVSPTGHVIIYDGDPLKAINVPESLYDFICMFFGDSQKNITAQK